MGGTNLRDYKELVSSFDTEIRLARHSLHDNTVPAYPMLNKSIENVIRTFLTVNSEDATRTDP